jgi:hypothetical protein
MTMITRYKAKLAFLDKVLDRTAEIRSVDINCRVDDQPSCFSVLSQYCHDTGDEVLIDSRESILDFCRAQRDLIREALRHLHKQALDEINSCHKKEKEALDRLVDGLFWLPEPKKDVYRRITGTEDP